MAIIENRNREFIFTEKDFNALRKISNEYTGIIVTDDKYDMYYARLVKRLRLHGLKSFSDYVRFLRANMDTEFTPFIDSITTNLTSFFREQHHFEQLSKQLLPELVSRLGGSGKINIWSAGCSTGEEPYSIAITALESLNNSRVRPWVLATDIDTTVLASAASGIYDETRINGIEPGLMKKWFYRGKGSKKGMVRVSQELQDIISFRQLNLIREWPVKDKFHIIFCRNVVIYFDRETKTELLNRFADQLHDNAFLVLGHSESLQGLTNRFKAIGKTVYRKLQ